MVQVDSGSVFSFKVYRLQDGHVWGAVVDALEAADGAMAGMVEGGFIPRAECTSRVIKFDSKQKTS
jgi:hypothetical protein